MSVHTGCVSFKFRQLWGSRSVPIVPGGGSTSPSSAPASSSTGYSTVPSASTGVSPLIFGGYRGYLGGYFVETHCAQWIVGSLVMRCRLCKVRQVRVSLSVVIFNLPFTCARITLSSLSLAPTVFPFGGHNLLMIFTQSPLAYICGTAVDSLNSSVGGIWYFSTSSLDLAFLSWCRINASWIFNSCSCLIRLSTNCLFIWFKKIVSLK